MVATVRNSGVCNDKSVPQPDHREVGAHDERPKNSREEVDHEVLQRVAVDGGNSNWSCPLVVGLVDVLVQTRVVEKSIGETERLKLPECAP